MALTDIYKGAGQTALQRALHIATEKTTQENGLVSALRQLHDALDAPATAVFATYGLSEEEGLERLVAQTCEWAREQGRAGSGALAMARRRPAGGEPVR